ncbi:MAG: glutamate--tRNA ligase [Defluviitaleaceae bacterium]|nr:glutamate--tRNA ligase [Defluviitaleaceae bacterium]
MIRTRFAPSPTGFMHLGNLRTALYAYLIAKNNNGAFLLRIEDTDTSRLVEGSLQFIYKTLNQAGIIYDEGPEKEGDCGPYIQSQRRDIYQKYAKELIKKGRAYYCFCQKEEKGEKDDSEKEQLTNKQPFRCHCPDSPKKAQITEHSTQHSIEAPYVIRQLIPQGSTTFIDTVYGEITVNNDELENQVLIKADGMPTYNFANVVDDHLMKITHVVRGSEYLSSTPKYNLLYNSFGWEIPAYIHLPLILNENKEKLSKRRGDANFEDLIEEGFLPQAVINYIALLGWAPGSNQEIFTLQELAENFHLDGISKSPAVFDRAKLTWFNGEYIKTLTPEDFYEMALPYLQSNIKTPVNLQKVAGYTQSRVNFAKEVTDLVDFIDQLPNYSTELFVHKKMKTNLENSLASLNSILPILESIDDFTYDTLHTAVFAEIERQGVKNSLVLWPIRTAISGKPTSFCGAIELLELFGKEESLNRIKIGIQKLEE